jgi:hypothetical protein
MTASTVFSRAGLAVLGLIILAGCASQEPATDAEKLARGRELLQQMSARLAAANAISVTTTETRDVVRQSGAKESLPGAGTYTIRRPDRFYARTTGGRNLESWYNGKIITIAAHHDKVFAQAPMPDTINRTLDALAERYDMPLPMGDLLYGPADKALLSETTTGGYAGRETVAGVRCVHLAFQDTGVEFDLWLPEAGEPLPKRFRVVQKHRTGAPVIDVTFSEWNLSAPVTDATFDPAVPADYEGVALLQRAAAIKTTTSPAAKP